MCPSLADADTPFLVTRFVVAKFVPENDSVGPRRSLQMAPARRNEDRGIRVECISVGHARHVIRDCTLHTVALGDPLVLRREQVGMLLEILEQLPENALRLAILGLRRAGE